MNKILQKTIKNDISEIKRIPDFLEEFNGIHKLKPNVIFSLNLALGEMVKNIIKHGYRDKKKHLIKLCLSIDAKKTKAIIKIEDDGIPFNPAKYSTPDMDTKIEDRTTGNMGIHIVRSITDTIEYKRKDKMNILTLKKQLKKS